MDGQAVRHITCVYLLQEGQSRSIHRENCHVVAASVSRVQESMVITEPQRALGIQVSTDTVPACEDAADACQFAVGGALVGDDLVGLATVGHRERGTFTWAELRHGAFNHRLLSLCDRHAASKHDQGQGTDSDLPRST